MHPSDLPSLSVCTLSSLSVLFSPVGLPSPYGACFSLWLAGLPTPAAVGQRGEEWQRSQPSLPLHPSAAGCLGRSGQGGREGRNGRAVSLYSLLSVLAP